MNFEHKSAARGRLKTKLCRLNCTLIENDLIRDGLPAFDTQLSPVCQVNQNVIPGNKNEIFLHLHLPFCMNTAD